MGDVIDLGSRKVEKQLEEIRAVIEEIRAVIEDQLLQGLPVVVVPVVVVIERKGFSFREWIKVSLLLLLLFSLFSFCVIAFYLLCS